MKTFLLLLILSTSFSWASNCIEQRNEREELSWIHCPKKEVTLFPATLDQREILWSLPKGRAPRGGWPVVILSQGSWFPVEFSRPSGLPLGGFNEVRLIQALLDQGFAVIAPRATMHVGWVTNIPHGDYKKRADYKVIAEVLERIKTGFWGPLNPTALFATGISSGGYHTSRLALSFPGRWKAIAIQSASYARCLGPLCQMPRSVPRSHPPTLFLHGARDLTVPLYTAQQFHALLKVHGIPTEMVINPDMGHGWIEEAPEAIVGWFKDHL